VTFAILSKSRILRRLQALTNAVQEAERDSKIQALILQSSSPAIFSAGLDLMELHQPQPERLQAFWRAFQNLYLTLYGSRLACIAAIEGHAPAAGCMLALSCDYRIMASSSSDPSKPPPTIGLNESNLGIAAPSWLAQQMIDTVGRRQAEIGLSLGTLYTPDVALKIQLVDAVVSPDQVRPTALEKAKKWGSIPAQARVASKQLVRKERLDTLRANIEQDINHFVGFVTDERVQKNLSAYVQMLAKKGKK
jgi:Delta3-Delta2-enoyl-CoA isomerase